MANKINFPVGGFTKEHATPEYINKLCGKNIKDGRFSSIHENILGVSRMMRSNSDQIFPHEICLVLENKNEIIIQWLVAVQLIEGGHGIDSYGFEYSIV